MRQSCLNLGRVLGFRRYPSTGVARKNSGTADPNPASSTLGLHRVFHPLRGRRARPRGRGGGGSRPGRFPGSTARPALLRRRREGAAGTEMALPLWKNLLQTTKERILQQRRLSLYTGAQGYSEKLIKKKLQEFPGGSINLSKEDNGIGILTLNNPKLMNAFTGTMMIELHERITELERWKDGKGLIVYGAGNTFCSGSDLNAVKEISNSQSVFCAGIFSMGYTEISLPPEVYEDLLSAQP